MMPDARSVSDRLRCAARLADLRPERRLLAKIGMRPEQVAARLRSAAALRDLCLRLGEIGRLARAQGRLR